MFDRRLTERRQKELAEELRKGNAVGVDNWTRKLSHAQLADQEDYLDLLAEGRFAVMLLRKGFVGIDMEPSDKGPDLKAELDKFTVFFEIKRRRPRKEDRQLLTSSGPFSPERPESINGIISDKLGQLCDDEPNVLVIWSDTFVLGIPEIEEAFKYIKQENSPGKYRNLSAMALVEDSRVDLDIPDTCELVPNDKAARPLPPSVIQKLQSTSC